MKNVPDPKCRRERRRLASQMSEAYCAKCFRLFLLRSPAPLSSCMRSYTGSGGYCFGYVLGAGGYVCVCESMPYRSPSRCPDHRDANLPWTGSLSFWSSQASPAFWP